MIKIKAHIKLYENGRKTPFKTGYRPLFSFIKSTKTSGSINLTDRDKFYPGHEGKVDITLLNNKYLGDNFGVGTRFYFYEGYDPLGEGEVTKLLSNNKVT